MQKQPFGKTGLDVTPVGFGGAEIGVLPQERAHVARLLNQLLDVGINVIDTAHMYKESEGLIGEAIGDRRDEYVLISKCGMASKRDDRAAWDRHALTANIDHSLEKLKTDHIDVMLLHSCPKDILENGEAIDAVVAAKNAGKVRHVGYSGDNEDAAYAAAQSDIEVLETSVSIADQVNIIDVLPLCIEHEVGVLAKRPIANAAWKDAADQPGGYGNYASTYHDRLKQMEITPSSLGFAEEDTSAAWAALALRFTLGIPGVHSAIIGTTNFDHVKANIAAASQGPLPDNILRDIRQAFAECANEGKPWTGQT